MLGCDPGGHVIELLAEHPAVPPTVIAGLAAALRPTGVDPAGIGVATAARCWLATCDTASDPGRGADVERRLSEVQADRHAVENALGPAHAVAERAAAGAASAARTVSSLEAELRARAGDIGRLVERAAAARQLRDQVEAVEARLAAAETEALEAWGTANDARAASEAERDRLAADLADLERRAAKAASDLPEDHRPAFDLVAGLGALGAALRAEAVALGSVLDRRRLRRARGRDLVRRRP